MKVDSKKYKNGDIICQQGDKTDKLFVLRSGKIKIIVNQEKKITPELIKSAGHVVNQISTVNQTIGEIGLLLNRERSASLIAEGAVELEIISFEGDIVLTDIIKHNKQIGISILHTVIDRIIHTAEQIHSYKKQIDDRIEFINSFSQPFVQMKFDEQEMIVLQQSFRQLLKTRFDIIADYMKSVNREFSKTTEFITQENNLLNKGMIFFKEDCVEQNIYLMLKGKVTVYCNKIPVFTCDKDNTIFCNYSILLNNTIENKKNYFEFAASVDGVKLKRIAKQQFMDLLEKEASLYGYLSKILSQLLVNTDKVLIEVKKRKETLDQIIGDDKAALKEVFLNILKLKNITEDQKKLAENFNERISVFN